MFQHLSGGSPTPKRSPPATSGQINRGTTQVTSSPKSPAQLTAAPKSPPVRHGETRIVHTGDDRQRPVAPALYSDGQQFLVIRIIIRTANYIANAFNVKSDRLRDKLDANVDPTLAVDLVTAAVLGARPVTHADITTLITIVAVDLAVAVDDTLEADHITVPAPRHNSVVPT
jgi:hypothetical protein